MDSVRDLIVERLRTGRGQVASGRGQTRAEFVAAVLNGRGQRVVRDQKRAVADRLRTEQYQQLSSCVRYLSSFRTKERKKGLEGVLGAVFARWRTVTSKHDLRLRQAEKRGGGMSTPSDLWCILRTSAGRTLKLARSLAAAGFDVWTPTETTTRRRPRSTKTMDREAPIMPTFVFARHRAADLYRAAKAQPPQHPPFSVFLHAGRAPLIADTSIVHLRKMEEDGRRAREERMERAAREALRKEKRFIEVGSCVHVDQDAWRGITGVVEDSDGKSAWIRFGLMLIEIPAWDVIENGIQALPEAA